MKFHFHTKATDSFTTPLLVVFGFEKEKGVEFVGSFSSSSKALEDFHGKFRSCALLYPGEGSSAERVLLLGLGKKGKLGAEEIRRVSAMAFQKARDLKLSSFAVVLDRSLEKKVDAQTLGAAFAEGSILGAYRYERFKTLGKEENGKKTEVEAVHFLGASANFEKGFEWGRIGAQSQCYVRDLANLPSNEKYPRMMASWAQQLVKGDSRFSCKVFDETQLKKLGMGALLGVGRGSKEPPRLVVLHYKPRGAKGKKIGIVGKGVTFDSGGISIKPSNNMDEMKFDMSGAAAVMGVFRALKELSIPHEIIGITPFTENLPGGNAQKPGDIVTAFNGVTIEVLNTDAEGRLILSDALAYAVKEYEPDLLIDLATLTGAVKVALGHELSGALGNDEKLIASLIESGKRTGEELWHLPLLEAHRDGMKSQIADLKNIAGPSMGAGTSAGAAFLSFFVGKTPWVHLDIAATAWGSRERDYYSKGSVGIGVRLILDFLKHRK